MTIVIKSIKSRSKTLKEGQNLLDEGLKDWMGATLRKITNSQTQEEKDAAIIAAIEKLQGAVKKADERVLRAQAVVPILSPAGTTPPDPTPAMKTEKVLALKNQAKLKQALKNLEARYSDSVEDVGTVGEPESGQGAYDLDIKLQKAEDQLQRVQGEISSLESSNTRSVDTWPNRARFKMQRLKKQEEEVEKAIRKIMGDPDPPPAAPTPTAAAAAATTLYTNAGNALKQVRRGRQREAMIDAIVDLLDQLGSSGAGQDFRDHLQTHRISGGRT